MDLLDRLLGHNSWTTRQLLLRSRGLSDGELDRAFDIGHRTLRATFQHIVRNMEVWTDLMAGGPLRTDPGAEGQTVSGLLGRLDSVSADLALLARNIARREGWDELWTDTLDDLPRQKTYGAAIAHILTHSMHHRAQALYLLRQLGVRDLPEGDVFSWENRAMESGRGTDAG